MILYLYAAALMVYTFKEKLSKKQGTYKSIFQEIHYSSLTGRLHQFQSK